MLLLTLLACDTDGNTPLNESYRDVDCESIGSLPDGQILAIGDSMFDFIGECADAPDLTGVALGARVTNEAVGGATMLDNDIPSQYRSEDWRWVIIDGGGNDLDCESESACLAILDEVEAAWRDLLDAVTNDGAQAALVGYPDFSIDSESGELWALMGGEMMARMSDVADDYDGAFFVDLRGVMNGEAQPELFDDDLIHPSPAGAGVIADEIARVISAND